MVKKLEQRKNRKCLYQSHRRFESPLWTRNCVRSFVRRDGEKLFQVQGFVAVLDLLNELKVEIYGFNCKPI